MFFGVGIECDFALGCVFVNWWVVVLCKLFASVCAIWLLSLIALGCFRYD